VRGIFISEAAITSPEIRKFDEFTFVILERELHGGSRIKGGEIEDYGFAEGELEGY
jgi:hypothetical protein